MNTPIALIAQALDQANQDAARLPLSFDNEAEAARFLVDAARVRPLLQSVVEHLLKSIQAVSTELCSKLDAEDRSTVRVDNGQVIVTELFTLSPRVDDLLPEGVSVDDRRYESTVQSAEAAARARLIHTLKSLPAYSGLVTETYDETLLAQELCDDEVPRNDAGVPVVPATLAHVLTVTLELEVIVTDEGGNVIGGGE